MEKRETIILLHLDIDPIELVKACPGPAGRKPLEELSHGDVVQSIGAVEYHALHRQGLRQVLRRFRLACARGT